MGRIGLIEFEIELPMFAGKEGEYNLIKNKRHFFNIKNASLGMLFKPII